MDDNFKLRVDKIFGSLCSSSSSSSSSSFSSSSLSSLWCLTDEEIEKKEWNRDKEESPESESTPYPPNLDGFFQNQQRTVSDNKPLKFPTEIQEDFEDLDEEEVDVDVPDLQKQQLPKPDDHDDEEWEIRSSIGLDCTLDFEEEEDQYDKLAVGRGKAGDRVFLSEINDYGTCSNSFNEIPVTFKDAARDPRANHMAAKLRLKEDAEAAGSFDSLTVSGKMKPTVVDPQVNAHKSVDNLKSILKRKESQSDSSRSQKRVRFDPECKIDFQEESEKVSDDSKEGCPMEEAPFSDGASLLPQNHSGVPDYLRNPSKYTCYTFDSSSEVDEESNRRAYMDFLNLVRRSNSLESQQEGAPVDLPKSVTFTPRKRTENATSVKSSADYKLNEEVPGKEFMQRKSLPISITAGEIEESEVCAMEEDEPETVTDNGNSSRKSGRQYRFKVRSELDHIT